MIYSCWDTQNISSSFTGDKDVVLWAFFDEKVVEIRPLVPLGAVVHSRVILEHKFAHVVLIVRLPVQILNHERLIWILRQLKNWTSSKKKKKYQNVNFVKGNCVEHFDLDVQNEKVDNFSANYLVDREERHALHFGHWNVRVKRFFTAVQDSHVLRESHLIKTPTTFLYVAWVGSLKMLTKVGRFSKLKQAGTRSAFLFFSSILPKLIGDGSIETPVQLNLSSKSKVLDEVSPSRPPHSMKYPSVVCKNNTFIIANCAWQILHVI